MGDIFRTVTVCGIYGDGDRLSCSEDILAFVDSGATKTVISSALALRLGGTSIPMAQACAIIEGRRAPLKLIYVKLHSPNCEYDVIAAAVDDETVDRAGDDAEMILGHDYLQNKRVTLEFDGTENGQVSCALSKKKRKRSKR